MHGTSRGKRKIEEVRTLAPFIRSFVMHPFLIIGAFLKCEIAKIGFEKNNISQGFEALARAQCLLRSEISLGKMTLLSQVTAHYFMFLP